MWHMTGMAAFSVPRRSARWRAACLPSDSGGRRSLGWVRFAEEYQMNGTMDVSATEDRAQEVEITSKRIGELIRWHGTDESALPPAHTLQNLSRDTVAALAELLETRETVAQLRAAMGRAFWATEFRDVHAILLEALGPPPEPAPSADSTRRT